MLHFSSHVDMVCFGVENITAMQEVALAALNIVHLLLHMIDAVELGITNMN